MTDAELIYALADDLSPAEIARKMEMRYLEVLRILRSKPRQVQRLGADDLRRASGGKPATAADLAEALGVEATEIRVRLAGLRRTGRARQVGERKTMRGAMAPLWMIEGRE